MSFNIKIGKVFGIRIEIHASWFIIFLLITWTLATAYFPSAHPELNSLAYWIMGIIAAILLFVSVLLHELSHSLVARKNGLPIRKITLFIFGGIAHMSDEPSDAATEFKMAIAGPLCSIALVIIFGFLAKFLSNLELWLPIYAVVKYLAWINGILAGFNLIPGFPLDGGRVLRAAIWKYTNDLRKSTLIASRVGKGFAFLLMGFGILSMLFTPNFISGIWLMFIGFFLYQAAEMGYMQVSLKKALTGIKVKDVMREDVITVDDFINLETLVNEYFFKYRYGSFPVVSPDDKIVGIITLNKVKEVDKNKWSQLKVSEVMDKNIDRISVYPDQEAASVMNRIVRDDIGRVLVINENKELVGLLTRRDIMQILKLRTDLGI